MPEKVDKIKLPEFLDRRIKLTKETKEVIKHKYSLGDRSLNSLTSEYNVSKKTILLIVNPVSKARNDARIKEHWRDYSHNHAEAIKKNRNYKKQLIKDGKLDI